ncbi:STAS domain-containing protein [Streptomyces fenghuangensis]|uniref:STAS domain-containing protein n=1 Tax=Streptomyces chitinivorans TaxID=1257027 RepID=A0ABW7HR99_9ACTN|nr:MULTISPECIES: STAS domain-containing protein [Streptomyces]MCG3043502.1 STAS domain-containing protein [Streptomyces sp. ICN903]MDH2410990.1 STAS domain-containing protein [Streptomyces chitinivorans]
MNASDAAVRDRLTTAIRERGDEIADRWVQLQQERAAIGIDEGELREEADALLVLLGGALNSDYGMENVVDAHQDLRGAVMELSLRRERSGATPTATSLAILALKDALLEAVERDNRDPRELFPAALTINRLLDEAAALSFNAYVERREEIIQRQSRQLLELSTPVVHLWKRILAVPLIGTLDTARTQVVMENLLQSIQTHDARVAIIDITGVPTVDTAVAQHLMQTVNAVRLMGADCFISGVRPSIAQTIAQLGIDLSTILTRATLADALAAAVDMTGQDSPATGATTNR